MHLARRSILIRSLGDKTPKVADTAWVSEFAYVVGDVEIGEHCSIWPGVTIRADGDRKIVIGNYVNVQEGSVIHGNGLVIEDYVTIGHSVVVHGDHIGEGSLLGNNCTFLHRSTLGKQCLIAANSVVLSGSKVPDRSFITGVPGAIKRQVNEQQIANMKRTALGLAERAKLFKESGL
jgi:carbonic anhydrase/acetyltransferase-like protein (isoleucine patch superfamily)